MGLPWIQVAKEFPKSPAAVALAHELRVTRHAAVGLAVEFWVWAADHAPDGLVVGALSSLVVDDAVGWRKASRALPSFAEAMVVAGLLEKLDDGGFRIVGWDRYAKTLEKSARDAARKRERRENGARSARAGSAPDAETARVRRAFGAGESQSQSQSQTSPSETEAPPPKGQHLPRVVEPPTSPPEAWTSSDFWRWCQGRRAEAGYVAERPPNERALGGWWSAARMTPGVGVEALRRGFLAFGADPYWEAKGFPFAGFMSQWEKYTQAEVKRGAAS